MTYQLVDAFRERSQMFVEKSRLERFQHLLKNDERLQFFRREP